MLVRIFGIIQIFNFNPETELSLLVNILSNVKGIQ